MAYAERFVRSRVVKVCAALCAISVLAFVLGQGAAALRVSLTAEPTAAARVVVRVNGARGTASTPTPTTRPTHTTFTTGLHQDRPLTAHAPLKPKVKPKDKHHSSHKRAAGDSSHGGPSHKKGDKQHGGKGGKSGKSGKGGKQQTHDH